jgi:hypothetical protein
MGYQQSYHHIGTLAERILAFKKHAVGFADAWSHSDEYFMAPSTPAEAGHDFLLFFDAESSISRAKLKSSTLTTGRMERSDLRSY